MTSVIMFCLFFFLLSHGMSFTSDILSSCWAASLSKCLFQPCRLAEVRPDQPCSAPQFSCPICTLAPAM